MMLRQYLIVLAMAITGTAYAHHSAAPYYDLSKEVEVEGVVTEFLLRNPHSRIALTVTSADGTQQEWVADGEAASVLKRHGWTDHSVPVGARIKITGAPSRSGIPKMEWVRIIFEDGSELLGGNAGRVEKQRVLENLGDKQNSDFESKD